MSLRLKLLAVACAFAAAGCATRTLEGDSIDMVSRGSNAVSRGDIASAFPRLRTIVIDIDRRTYMGNIEPTPPNETFGFNRRYGPGRYATGPSVAAGRNDHYKAILSSSDNHLLRCDLTQREDKERDGLCVDDFGNIYDVVTNRQKKTGA